MASMWLSWDLNLRLSACLLSCCSKQVDPQCDWAPRVGESGRLPGGSDSWSREGAGGQSVQAGGTVCRKGSIFSVLSHSILSIWDLLVYSPSGSSVHGILQARILEWVAMLSSRGSSQPSNWTQVSCIAGRFFANWATREASQWYITQPLKEMTWCYLQRRGWT